MRLSASALHCQRGGREVLAGVSFRIAAGEALLVQGPNGAGKTTLLRTLAGLLRLSAGRIELAGGDPERTLAEQAHYLGHLDALKPALTVTENLLFWRDFLGGAGDFRAALATLGLEPLADLPAAYLSAGQRRRLSIARLIAVHRPIWLLDEPAAALDIGAKGQLSALMQAHLSKGGIVVAATHGPIGVEPANELRLDGGSPPQWSGDGAPPPMIVAGDGAR